LFAGRLSKLLFRNR